MMERTECDIEPFEMKLERNFSQQYFSTYRIRLETQTPLLLAKIKSSYSGDEDPPQRSISDIIPNEQCIIIGTIIKEMKRRPSVLKVLSDNCHLSSLISKMRQELVNFVDPSDKLYLEDSNQRIELVMNTDKLQTDRVITGVTAALIGHCPDEDRGQFSVDDVIFPGPLTDTNSGPSEKTKPRYILLVSGLNLGSPGGAKSDTALKVLSSWLSGKMGDLTRTIGVDCKDVCRAFIVGDSVSVSSEDQESYVISKFAHPKQMSNLQSEDQSTRLMSKLDSLLADSLCPYIPVDLLASSRLGHDASVFCSPLLPQPGPASMALFDRSLDWNSFNTRVSPFHFNCYTKKVTIITGETLIDMARCTCPEKMSSLDCMEAMLHYGHLAPTCPDTLPGSPLFYSDPLDSSRSLDPLVLPWLPDLFVAGNQPKFAYKKVEYSDTKQCLCVSVPVFSDTLQCVLVDVENADVNMISLKGINEL